MCSAFTSQYYLSNKNNFIKFVTFSPKGQCWIWMAGVWTNRTLTESQVQTRSLSTIVLSDAIAFPKATSSSRYSLALHKRFVADLFSSSVSLNFLICCYYTCSMVPRHWSLGLVCWHNYVYSEIGGDFGLKTDIYDKRNAALKRANAAVASR